LLIHIASLQEEREKEIERKKKREIKREIFTNGVCLSYTELNGLHVE